MTKLDNKYRIGIDSIDEQHGDILGVLQVAISNLKNKKNKTEALYEVLNLLKLYALKHFDYEEKWMIKEGYPDLVHHQKLHQEFKEKLQELQQNLGKNSHQKLIKTVEFIRHWFLNHIQIDDKDFGTFYLKKNDK